MSVSMRMQTTARYGFSILMVIPLWWRVIMGICSNLRINSTRAAGSVISGSDRTHQTTFSHLLQPVSVGT